MLFRSPFEVQTEGALTVRRNDSGIEQWLAFHGIDMQDRMVLDPQNSAFPIPVNRRIGDFTVRETRLVDYPYFVDIRDAGMRQGDGITSGLDQVTLTWASPITVDAKKNQGHKVTRLLESTDQAWTSDSLQIQPDFRAHGKLGFPLGAERGQQLLAAAVEGRFESYFKGKPSPLEADTESTQKTASAKSDSGAGASSKETSSVITREIDRSPESARIILFGSNSFLSDKMLELASSGLGTRYLNPVQLVENAVDWSLEDRGLLTIRGRSQYLRTLEPLDRNSEVFWEYLNYGLALLGLLVVWAIRAQVNRRARRRYAVLLGTA